MISKKTTLVADVLHGTISLSPLEKRLVSTEIFNRLHNILQNSTVYFTYPSNRTSRFNHSLGCLKIAGDMFRNSLLNVKPDVLKRFLSAGGVAVKAIENTQDFRNQLRQLLSKTTDQNALQFRSATALLCPFYSLALLPSLSSTQEYYFVLLFQALRFAALLHDVGHTPFSHVAEFALDSIFDILKNNGNKPQELYEQFAFYKNKGTKFHEALGNQLAEILLDQLITELKDAGAEEKYLNDTIVIRHLTLAILKNSTPFLHSLHSLVDSDLDADRLDYVQRDLMMSGFSREPLRIERLIQTYTLIEDKGNKDVPFQFAASIRALNNIEDFYKQRYHLYKYAIYHHRVVKFDALMYHCIVALTKKHLAECGNITLDEHEMEQMGVVKAQIGQKRAPKPDDSFLSRDISGLWQILHPDARTYPATCANYYIQWDDAWLLNVLRSEYFLLKKIRKNHEKSILEARLEELLSNRKQYHALFKRAECFLEIDQAFIEACGGAFDDKKFVEKGTVTYPDCSLVEIAHFRDYLKDANRAIKANKATELTALVENNGYALASLSRMVVKFGMFGYDSMDFINDAAKAVGKNRNIRDIIVIPKKITPGVTNCFTLADSDGNALELGRVSRVADELDRASLLFPPFFVFIYPREGLDDNALSEIRKDFGRNIWAHFDKWMQEI